MNEPFKALVARKDDEFSVNYENLTLDDLGDGNVTVQVEYSTLNFKDGLAMTNAAPVVQRYPLVLGIDFAGTVLESGHSRFSAGDKVILNGYEILNVKLKEAAPKNAAAMRKQGHFGFISHADPVAFRNIRIKELNK